MNADEPGAVEFIGFWYRLGAFLWDLVIVGVLASGLIAALIGDQANTEHGKQMAALLVASVAVPYTLGFWLLTGTTPGKWLCSSRIVDVRSGEKPQIWQCLVRYLGYGLSAVPLLLGFLWAGWSPQRRAWHDLLARTAVVGDPSLRNPSELERAEARYCIEQAPWRADS